MTICRLLPVQSHFSDRKNRAGVFRCANEILRKGYPKGESLPVSFLRLPVVQKLCLFQRSRRVSRQRECCGQALLATRATNWGEVPRGPRSADYATRSRFPQTRISPWEATLMSALL